MASLKIDNNNDAVIQERTIFFVHVGKAGGTTYRRMMLVHCAPKEEEHRRAHPSPRNNETQAKCDSALKQFPNKLSTQTTRVLHQNSAAISPKALQSATTFLIALRQPMERLISAYRYSHPANCRAADPSKSIHHGCYLVARNLVQEGIGHQVYKECFPSPEMEDFAQSLLPPYDPNKSAECRKLARTMARGYYVGQTATPHQKDLIIDINPHMYYNYRFYADATIYQAEEKPVFALRTESEWDDLVTIDRWIGGQGKFPRQGEAFDHYGSQKLPPSPLSALAYQKVCCILTNEIEVYFDLLGRAQNIHQEDLQQAKQDMQEKCGATEPWQEWQWCQKKLREVEREA